MQTRIRKDYSKRSYTFEFGSADQIKVATIDPALGIKGEVAKLIVTIPNWSNDVTAVVSMDNADSKEMFAADPLDRNDEYNITLIEDECIIMGATGEQWEVTLSGVPGGTGGTVTVTAYVIP